MNDFVFLLCSVLVVFMSILYSRNMDRLLKENIELKNEKDKALGYLNKLLGMLEDCGEKIEKGNDDDKKLIMDVLVDIYHDANKK